MRVGIVALLQESNTFIAERTTLAHFQEDMLVEGEEVRRRLAGSHHEVAGFFAGLEEAKLEAVPIFAGRALPFGVIATEAFAILTALLEEALRRAGRLDGLLVAPHGATVSEAHPDSDGYWLSRVRTMVGKDLPIIGTLDPHANLSPTMARACDALIAYRSNPHLDQKQRGLDAARLMARTLRGEVRPVLAAEFLPMAINIERQHTAEPPCRPLYERADRMLSEPGILSNSLVLGFPYADVEEMGCATMVVADGDLSLARRKAAELAAAWWEGREGFVGKLIDVDAAVDLASQREGPVCLLDMGDNVGGGSPGDGTMIIHALERRGPAPSFACLFDPEAAAQARAAGVGGRVRLAMGGHGRPEHGTPLVAEVIVRGLYDGRFEEPQPRHGGFTTFDQGPTAVVETPGRLTLMLTTRRMVPFSLRQLTTFGLDPAHFRVLVAKGVHAPVAAYAPVSKSLIRVDTPGVTSADLDRLTYDHRRRPLFPFERDMKWEPTLTGEMR